VSAGAAPTATAATPGIVVSGEKAVITARPGMVQQPPAVGWNGKRYLVVWTEFDPNVGGSSVYAARVTPSGTVLDPQGILLKHYDPPFVLLRNPAVAGAGGGGNFLVAYEDWFFEDIGATLVTNAGTVRKQWCAVCVDNTQTSPSVTWSASNLFLLTWEDTPNVNEKDIYGERVTSDGLALDGCSADSCPDGNDPGIPVGALVGPDETQPAVAANAHYFISTWTEADSATTTGIADRGVAFNGTALQHPTTVSDPAGAQSDSSIAHSGPTFLVAWSDRRTDPDSDIYATLLRPGNNDDESQFDPSPVSPNGVLVSGAAHGQTVPSVAKRGTGYVVVWADARNATGDIYGARVNGAGTVLDKSGVRISATARVETDPVVAAGASNQLVAYRHPDASGVSRIYFRLLS
jgi:hypothetical protein